MHPVWEKVGVDLPEDVDIPVACDLGDFVNDKTGFE